MQVTGNSLLERLPTEMHYAYMEFLPAKDIIPFASVSKHMRRISGEKIQEYHLRHKEYNENLPEICRQAREQPFSESTKNKTLSYIDEGYKLSVEENLPINFEKYKELHIVVYDLPNSEAILCIFKKLLSVSDKSKSHHQIDNLYYLLDRHQSLESSENMSEGFRLISDRIRRQDPDNQRKLMLHLLLIYGHVKRRFGYQGPYYGDIPIGP